MIPSIQMSLKRWRPQRILHSLGNIFRRNHNSDGCDCDWKLPTRRQQLKSLQQDDFDVLVIGGGAVGCGCALEAASRGLKTALIEAEDFGSGASSKSSKLVEGGSSYLQAAIQGADLQQIFMLQQVLTERATMLRIAPHLNRVQPMLMPIYSPLRLPFYWLGLKLYDAMAGKANVRASHFLSQEETLDEFPLLRRHGLLGSLVYYDGQMDDARMCLALALTAAKNDATIANYVKLRKLLPTGEECICRKAIVEDTLKNTTFTVKSRCVINATGAGTDLVRRMDDCASNAIALPKLGTHIALPSHFGSSQCGLLFPSKQLDEETMFMLPFENRVLVGSLYVEPEDTNCLSTSPKCEMVDCLLDHTREVLDECALLRPDHVLSAWTGVMPAIMCPDSIENNEDEEKPDLVPHFLVEVSGSQMITLAGGRWSSYRVMASDAIDAAIEHCCLEPQVEVSSTQNLLLDGAEDYCSMLPIDLVQNYDLPMDVAQHLADSYGCNAYQVLLKTTRCDRQRLHPHYPYIKAEVDYACQREYACQLTDVIARRLRIAFVDASAAFQMLPKIQKIMAKRLCWDDHAKDQQLQAAKSFLMQEMGLGSIVKYTPLFTDKKKTKKKEKEKEKDEESKKSVTLPSCNTCAYTRVKASTLNDNNCKKPAKSPNQNFLPITMKENENKTNNFEILGGSKSCKSGCHKVSPQSFAPRRDFGSVLNNKPEPPKMQSSSTNISDTIAKCSVDSLANRISKFQSRKLLSEAEAKSKKSNIMKTNTVTQTGDMPKSSLDLSNILSGKAISATNKESMMSNQVVNKEQSPLSTIGKITTPNPHPKAIATHTITGAEKNRKATQENLSRNINYDVENFLTEKDIITEAYATRDVINTSKPNSINVGSSDNLGNTALKQAINSTNPNTIKSLSRNRSPISQAKAKVTKPKLEDQETTKVLIHRSKDAVKKHQFLSGRNSANIPGGFNKASSSNHLKKKINNSMKKSVELSSPKPNLKHRKHLEAQLQRRINVVKEELVPKIGQPLETYKKGTTSNRQTKREPSEDSFSTGKLFVRKIKYPTNTRSTLDDSSLQTNNNRSTSDIAQRSSSMPKTPAMRLQSLLNKEKYNARTKKDVPNTKGLISSNSNTQKSSSRGSSPDNHPKCTETETQPSHFSSKGRLFTRKSNDPNSSKTFTRPEPNPKLR